ncbi:Hvo_1808 family surface protein [Halostella salina]|uniref:Hvo_1808 family surface protein n=1 Tax=Halostella salina TaxID=1547897 RepID=UPI000EF7D71E|nr:Hvo_1808 family surface protein [Halostella salina]
MRSLRPLVLVALLVLAGCTAPATPGADRTATTAAQAQPTDGEPAPTDGEPNGTTAAASDRTEDVQGWEDGYWYNDTLSVNASDGLTDAELDAVVARSMARVERVRGVEFDSDVPVSVISRAEYRNDTAATGTGGGAFANVRNRALFLVGDDADAADVAQENRASAVLGYYDIRDDRIVLVSDSEQPRVDEITLAQELYHAYQFRYGNAVEPRIPPTASDDRVAALLSLIEGDANLVDERYAARCEAEWDCLRPRDDGGDGNASTAGIHMGLYIHSYFPYAEGQAYVESVRERAGWEGVSDLYADPPTSTAAVIHGGTEEPIPLSLPDRSTADWERVGGAAGSQSTTLGERGLATMFAYTLYDDRDGAVIDRAAFVRSENGSQRLDYDINYSNGWGNDRLYAYENGDRTGYVWRIRWDDVANATEFVDGYEKLLAYHGAERRDGRWVIDDGPFAANYYVEREDEAVTLVSAPSKRGVVELYPAATAALSSAD